MNAQKTILITGGCGFVGSCLACYLKQNYPNYHIIAFDNLKRRGSELNLKRLKDLDIEFVHGDVRNPSDLQTHHKITTIIDAAAEPSVLAGINEPTDYLIQTNFNGTINLLNLALKHQADFIFLSTSRVYPIQNINKIKRTEHNTRFEIDEHQTLEGISQKGINESFSLNGSRSLYGASKLASELFVEEYNAILGLKTVINRCGVLTGAYQMGKVDQGVMVLWVAKHYFNAQLGYFGYGGKGKQVRDVLHIKDFYSVIDYQIHHIDAVNGNLFNVGGGQDISVSLQELTKICQEITGNTIPIAKIAENRAADIPIYITDNTKITQTTGWKPQTSVRDTVVDIYEWIKNNENELKNILN